MRKAKLDLAAQSNYIVEAQNISKEYHLGKVSIVALKAVNLQIQRGEVVAIMGPSGCGKTTLLNCLSGLDDVSQGTIKIVGHNLNELTDDEITEFRAHQMGFVFQTYNLLPILTAVENVELSLLLCDIKAKEARQRATEALERVGMAGWAKHKPSEMSGGQRQRVTIARALVTRPAIVWADEPTGALDSDTGHEIIELMLQLNKEKNQTFVWVTHASEVAAAAQRLISMRDGLIVEDSQVISEKNVATL